ncbi:hypothetical protein BTZ20_4334 [Rhodococcus sp. MTM3W5.2]|nr:hypothetical protein BTZ20_4334 [Rhodococcus sp. MTM3W5.2]
MPDLLPAARRCASRTGDAAFPARALTVRAERSDARRQVSNGLTFRSRLALDVT